MSMITGCPACGTMFKVVADQLKISEGWVRCGCCGEVFDATQSLRPDAGPVPAATGPAPAPSAAAAAATEPVSMAMLLAVPVAPSAPEAPAAGRPGLPTGQAPGSDPQAGPHPKPSLDPATGAALDPQSDPVPEPSDAPADVAMAAELPGSPSGQSWDSQPAAVASRFDEWQSMREQEDEGGSLREAPDSVPGSGLDDVSFVRQARRQAFRSRPLVRLALLLVAVALAGVLALQLAVHDRDRLAQVQPRLRPLLEQVCSRLGCSITAPRRIEAIVIDSSGFTRLRPDVYRLSFTIKNQSPLPVATPALQLTLTDSGEQAVVQRVLLPRELGAAPATIGPASAWSSSVALGVDAVGGDASRIAGYRLLAFYP